MSSNSHSPCAACKFLRRKCTQECVFAPYFPPDHPQKFASVHRIYGASNVSKILTDIHVAHREDAVASLAYEAESLIQDPIHGCLSYLSHLQARLDQIHSETIATRKEIAACLSSASNNNSPSAQAAAIAAMNMMMYQSYPSVAVAGPVINNVDAQMGYVQSQTQPNQMLFALDNNQAYTGEELGLVVENGDVYPVAQQLHQLQRQQQAHQEYHHHHHHHQISNNNNMEAQLLLNDGNSNVSRHNHHHHHHHQDNVGADIDYKL